MSSTFGRLKRALVVAVFTFGIAALMAVLPVPFLDELVPAVLVFGWFLLAPYVAFFDVPFLDDGDDAQRRETESGPLQTLQEQYAAGKISEAEFDRKVDRILQSSAQAPQGMGTSGSELGSLSDLDVSGTSDDAERTSKAQSTVEADPADPDSVVSDSAVPDDVDAGSERSGSTTGESSGSSDAPAVDGTNRETEPEREPEVESEEG